MSPTDLDLHTAWDVIVVGSGIAGLTAALTAADAGLRTCVLEKAAVIGGTTAYSEAMVWIPGSAQARNAGITDSPNAALQYLQAAAGSHFDAALGRAYVDHAAEALQFLESRTAARYEITSGSIDYYPDLPGATRGARALTPLPFDGRRLGHQFRRLRAPLATTMIFGGMTVMGPDLKHFYRIGRSLRSTLVAGRHFARYAMDRLTGYPRGTVIAGGNGVLAALMLALQERGVPIATDSRVVALLARDRRVEGVRVQRSDAIIELSAARAVVLAAGGFPRNLQRQAELYPHVAAGKAHWTLAPASNEGDSLTMALALGAEFRRDVMEPAAWAPVSLVPTGTHTTPIPHFGDRAKPGVITVDRRGRRFVNEAISYHDFVPAMVAACRNDPDVEVYLIADHEAQRRYGLGAAPPFPGRLEPHVRSGYLSRASTLRELASQLGIDGDALTRTVEAFNSAAAHGEDPLFGRGRGAYDRSNGDATHAPNPCLAPLKSPPYYAIRVVPGDLGTFAGLRTDRYARVLDGDTFIAGLYAVGNDMASAMGGSYPGAGITVGSALTFAYLAGQHIAAKI